MDHIDTTMRTADPGRALVAPHDSGDDLGKSPPGGPHAVMRPASRSAPQESKWGHHAASDQRGEMDRRAATISRLTEALGALQGVASVGLRGSLARGTGDRYSDIDLTVGFPRDRVSCAGRWVIAAVEAAFPVELVDWAPSLLPDSPVITFFLEGLPIFWTVDVSIDAPPELRDMVPDMVHNDPMGHLLKLWTATLKHTIRNDPRSTPEIQKVWLHAVGDAPCPPGGFPALAGALQAVRASGRFPRLVDRCSEELAAAVTDASGADPAQSRRT